MGPKVITLYKDKQGTIYNIRIIPLGGYVMMAGEGMDESDKLKKTGKNIDEITGEEKNQEPIPKDQLLDNKKPWVQAKVLLAGSTMNLLLTVLLMILVAFFGGIASPQTNQITVIPGSPMADAGVETGDQITMVDDQKVSNEEEIGTKIKASGDDVEITYIADDVQTTKTIEKDSKGLVGITPYHDKYNFFQSIIAGVVNTVKLFIAIILSIALLFSDKAGLSDLAGPVGIYSMSSQVVGFGFVAAMVWIAYLSINIGFMNLLPIPVLDGGRLVFVFYEMIFKKPIAKKIQIRSMYVGMILLLSLLAFATYNDILRIFT